MSSISQYNTRYTPVTGNKGYSFNSTTALSATVPIGTTSTDLASVVVQEGQYLCEFNMTLAAKNTGTLTDIASYISTAAAGAAKIANQSEVITTMTLASDHTIYWRISKVIDVTAANTTIYGGLAARVGVVAIDTTNVLMKMTKLSP